MAIRRYSREQLLALRDSPLVQKPDHLPAIEQWIEYVYLETRDGVREKLRIPHSEAAQAQQQSQAQQAQAKENNGGGNAARQQQQQRQQRAGLGGSSTTDGASPMGSFSTGQRPSLLQMRSGVSRGHGEDVSLGPPRTMFPSSSRVSKLSDFQDRSAADGAAASDEPDSVRSRFFSDRQANRKGLSSDKEGRDTRESWTSARERRALGEHDDSSHGRDRFDRFGRSDRDQDGERRNGHSDRHESRWGPRDERRQNGERVGGWREREQQRRERDNDRGHDKEPEWLDDPVIKQDQELNFGMARTQEEFQKWKEGMSKKAKGQPEKEESVEAPAEAASTAPESKPATVAPLKLEGMEGDMFGGWGTSNKAVVTPQNEAVPAKAPAGKGKTSRFASMFKPAAEEPPPPSAPPAAVAPEETNAQNAATAEDQAGFNRVLLMLGGTKASKTPVQNENTPASPPPNMPAVSNGAAARSKSRFTDIFEQKSPERLQSPPQQGGFPPNRENPIDGHVRHLTGESIKYLNRQTEGPAQDQQMPRGQAPASTMSPEPTIPFNAFREQQPRPSSSRVNDPNMFSPPSRGAATPDINIQNLLAQQRQRSQATSNESQQLLNLLKKDTASRPSSQQALPTNGGIDSAQFQRWLESQHSAGPAEPHAPKPRMPQPPGMFEEQLMRNFHSDQPRHEPTGSLGGNQDMAQRRPSQRVPPGFFDEQSIFLQQQQAQQQQQLRRNFGDGQQQPPMQPPNPRLGGHPNLPPMQIPPQQGGGPQYPPEFHQLTSPGGTTGPPPGFNPMMPRHPPGFHNLPNLFQNAPQHREGPPPGFGGVGGSGGGGNSAQSPHAGPPPGFFPAAGGPPGMAPPPGFLAQMRSPTDGMPPGLRGAPGRGFEGFDPASVGLGPRR